MSGVKNIIFRCYILLFSTDGWGGLMYFSISLHILCEVPRSFLPILIVYMENDPKFTARERGFELKFVSKMRNQILYDIKQNIQVKSERIP